MQEETGVPREKPVVASLNWKPNGHTVTRTGNQTRAQWFTLCRGSTAALPASHFVIHGLIPHFSPQKVEIFIPVGAFRYIMFICTGCLKQSMM